MSTLVTGGTGYIGQYIVGRLATAGTSVVSYNRDYAEGDDENVTLVQGELYDLPRLLDTFERHSIDRIIHTAALSHPDLSIDLPVTTFTANVEGTLIVYEAARLAGIERIVNFSSECAYGHQPAPVRESARLRPRTPYGVTKVTTEMLADVYNDLYGCDVVSLRIPNVYGPGNKMPEILRDVLKTVLTRRPVSLPDGSDHHFNFIHVEDVADAAILASTAPIHDRPRVFNVSSGEGHTLAQAAEIVRELVPGAEIQIGPGYWHFDRQGPWDISAARRHLGYEPRYDLKSGLKAYCEWLARNPY